MWNMSTGEFFAESPDAAQYENIYAKCQSDAYGRHLMIHQALMNKGLEGKIPIQYTKTQSIQHVHKEMKTNDDDNDDDTQDKENLPPERGQNLPLPKKKKASSKVNKQIHFHSFPLILSHLYKFQKLRQKLMHLDKTYKHSSPQVQRTKKRSKDKSQSDTIPKSPTQTPPAPPKQHDNDNQ